MSTNDERQGWPTTAHTDGNIARLRQLVLTDRTITTRMIAQQLRISKGTVQTILHDDLEMKNS